MPPSKELAKNELKVPDLVVPTADAVQIESGDVALPRIKLGQPNASIVQDGLVPAHSIYAVTGSDDPEPVVLHELGASDEVLFHVLAMRKSWSLSQDGELQTWAWDDPTRDKDAWVVYNFVLALPEHDADVPYKMLFTRTGTPAAKQINTVLARNAGRGPSFMTAFKIKTDKREKQLGNSTVRWTVPRVRSVDATQEGVDTSAHLFEQISASLDSLGQTTAAPSDEPAI
jgi:hypothetical protein